MYKQLTSSQRYVIKNGLKENVPLRMIARLIGVSPSTVSREIKRNSSKTGVFIPALANERLGEIGLDQLETGGQKRGIAIKCLPY